MLTEPEREISVIADALALSVKDVLAAISALTDLSLLQASPDSPDAFRPVSPHLAFQTIVRRREANLARSQDELAAVQAAIAIAAAYQQPIAPDRTEHLSAPEVVQARLDTLAAHTATEWLVVLTGASQPIGMSLSLSLDHCMTDRGVQVLILLQDSLRKDTAVFGHALWSIKMGGQARTAPLLPTEMLVSDRRVAVLPVDHTNPADGAVCTREPSVVGALTAVFNQAWESAQPLSAHTAPDSQTGLAAGERELLRLLATGMTDETAASRLGISLRTARRQMAHLMECLGATSRFQAGAQAVRHGWLDQMTSSAQPTEAGAGLRSVAGAESSPSAA